MRQMTRVQRLMQADLARSLLSLIAMPLLEHSLSVPAGMARAAMTLVGVKAGERDKADVSRP